MSSGVRPLYFMARVMHSAAPDEVERIHERVDAASARRHARRYRAVSAEGERHLAGGHVGYHAGQDEGRDRARPALVYGDSPLLHNVQAPATRVEHHGHVLRIALVYDVARIVKRLLRASDSEVREAGHAPRSLRVNVIVRVEALYFACYLYRRI